MIQTFAQQMQQQHFSQPTAAANMIKRHVSKHVVIVTESKTTPVEVVAIVLAGVLRGLLWVSLFC
jgi:hypothetical protein